MPFNGTIQGAGKGVTIIRSVRGPGGAPFTPFYVEDSDMAYPITFFILTLNYFGVRDMTFEADSEIVEPYWYGGFYLTGLFSYVNLGSGRYGVGSQIGTDCINVHFKGSLDFSGKPEMPYMFEPYGGGGGTHNCKSCEFENGLVSLLKYALIANATINIGGSPSEKVTFTNALGASITTQCGDCTVNVSHIETNDAPGLYFFTHPENIRSGVNVTRNRIKLRPDSSYAGAEIWARYGEVSAVISNNKIHSPSHIPPFGAIFSFGVDGAVVTNNIITGEGYAAIYVGMYNLPTEGCLLKGNNVQNFNASLAQIILGPRTSNYTVIGGSNKCNVIDNGTDNIIVGVNNMGYMELGQDIKEAIEKKKEMIENLWK